MNNESFEPNYSVINDEFVAEQKRKNGFSIAALVLGIISIVCCCIDYLGLVCAILAIVFAVLDKKRNAAMNGMALAGLICGIIGAVICAYSIISGIINPPAELDESFWEEYFAMLEELMNSVEDGGETIFRALPFLR
ncbi:MAG: DUF4190 domain-containing protein [Clostridia bacterium]|nr:DUF4190 domain-containing protein [Clostridia bacterium]